MTNYFAPFTFCRMHGVLFRGASCLKKGSHIMFVLTGFWYDSGVEFLFYFVHLCRFLLATSVRHYMTIPIDGRAHV